MGDLIDSNKDTKKVENPFQGSGLIVDDFSSFCEGDKEPTLNKTINHLIDTEADYIVYIDEDYFIEWSLTDKYEKSDAYKELVIKGSVSKILNRTSHIEALSLLYINNCEKLKLSFSRILAEGPSRLFGDKDVKSADEALDKAEDYLKAIGKEKFISGAVTSAGLIFMILLLSWFYKGAIVSSSGQSAFEVGFGSLMGGIGAFGFLLTHQKEIILNPSGPRIHFMEGIYRIVVGIICALLVSLAIKANLIFGVTKSIDNTFAYSLAACMLSGVSERFGPDLLKNPMTGNK